MSVATLNDSPLDQARSLLRENPMCDLHELEIRQFGDEIVIDGIVPSYYLKQMAQETVRPVLFGRRIRNKVVVTTPK